MAKKINVTGLKNEIKTVFATEYKLTMAERLYAETIKTAKKALNADINKKGTESQEGQAIQKVLNNLNEANKKQLKVIREERKDEKFSEKLVPKTLFINYKKRLEGENKPFEDCVKVWLQSHGVENMQGIGGFCNSFGRAVTTNREFFESGKRTTSFKESKLEELWVGYIQDLLSQQRQMPYVGDSDTRKNFAKDNGSSIADGKITCENLWEKALIFTGIKTVVEPEQPTQPDQAVSK